MRPAVFAMLSLRYWRRRLGRALSGVVGVALGVALVVSVVAVNREVVRTYGAWVEALVGGGIVELRAIDSGGVDAGLTDLLRSVAGVGAAGGVVEQKSYLFTERQQSATTVLGVEVGETVAVAAWRLVAGRRLDVGDATSTVLSVAAAAALDVGVGGSVSLLSAEGLLVLNVVGLVSHSELGGVELPGSAREQLALIPIDTARQAFMQGREVVTQIEVQPTNVSDLDGLRERLRAAAGPGVLVRLPADELRELAAATSGLRSLLLLGALMALVAAVFLIGNNLAAGSEERAHDLGVVRALGLPGRLAASWFMAEAAVMGVLGSLLGASLGIVGAGGLLRRLPSDRFLAPDGPSLSVGVDVGAALGGAAVGVLVTLLVALPVALRAARRAAPWSAVATTPGPRSWGQAAGRRPARRAGVRRRAAIVVALLAPLLAVLLWWWRGWWADVDHALPGSGAAQATLGMLLVLCLAALLSWSLPRLFGGLSEGVRSLAAPPLWLRLATDSLKRHARRTGTTAVSLSITLASMVGVYGAADSYHKSLAGWLDATVTWDLLISSEPLGGAVGQPLPASVLAELARVPGVLELLPERKVTVSAAGRAVELLAFDTAVAGPLRHLRVVDSSDQRPLGQAMAGPKQIAVSLALAARLGIAPGDSLWLTTPFGDTPFNVVASVEGGTTDAGSAYIDSAVYADAFGDPLVDEIGVTLRPGNEAAASIPALAAAVREHLGERYPVQIISAAAYRQEALDGLSAAFAVVRAMVMLAVIVALVGLLNALLIGFWQLRRQFALLRALGAPTTMMMRTLGAEALLTMVAGTVSGILLGTVLSAAVLYGLAPLSGPLPGWSLPLQAYLNVLLLLFVTILCGVSLVIGRVRLRRPVAAARAD